MNEGMLLFSILLLFTHNDNDINMNEMEKALGVHICRGGMSEPHAQI